MASATALSVLFVAVPVLGFGTGRLPDGSLNLEAFLRPDKRLLNVIIPECFTAVLRTFLSLTGLDATIFSPGRDKADEVVSLGFVPAFSKLPADPPGVLVVVETFSPEMTSSERRRGVDAGVL